MRLIKKKNRRQILIFQKIFKKFSKKNRKLLTSVNKSKYISIYLYLIKIK